MKNHFRIFLCFFSFLAIGNAQNIAVSNLNFNKKVTDTVFYHPNDSIKQVDLIDYLRKYLKVKPPKTQRNKRKFQFSLFPAEATTAGGRTVVTSFNASFLLGDISKTNVSTIYFVPYISFSDQYGFQLRPDIWLNNNNWNFTGEYFVLNYPQSTWGLGGSSLEENETMVDYKHIRVYQNVLKGILPYFSVGIGFNYDNHFDVKVEEPKISYLNQADNQTISSGFAFPVVYDSRKNSNNPRNGVLANLTYRLNTPFLGSNNNWQSFFFDFRKYFPLNNKMKDIIAVRSYYWSVVSGKVPYLDLPANNWEPTSGRVARGIEQNRYRSNAMLYSETEYRFGITRDGFLGGVIFSNIVSASEYQTQNFMKWHPAAGFGLRMKFNKYSHINVTLDYGFSKGYQSLYLNIAEVF